jgi:precorrin-6Y C5,15-methyltransferase (decarboxylating)
VAIIGITDSGADSLTAEARTLVDQAAVLCGGSRHLSFFPHHAAKRFRIGANIDELEKFLLDSEEPAVVLASGDPIFYGIGPRLAHRLGHDRVRILPNIGSVQLAFSRLGESWEDAEVLSAHGRPIDHILPAALVARKVAILTDNVNTPGSVAQTLINSGDDPATSADVFEHLAGSSERHVATTLDAVRHMDFASLNLLVIRRSGPPPPIPFGSPEDAYAHSNGLITKPEVRVVSLSKLRLHERAVVWDIGAGSGSLSIEAAALARHGGVYAVERDQQQLTYLQENRRRFAAGNVHIVEGEAPEALTDLPSPDAVFVGGAGGRLAPIVTAAAERIALTGRIVLNLVSVEHVAEVLRLAAEIQWEHEVTQLSAARSVVTGGLTRLAALNPVFVVALDRSN